MAIASMTGFARTEGHLDTFTWIWEMRSVNSKSLDLRFRMPTGFEALENTLKQYCAERIKRGTVNATLTVHEDAPPTHLRLNEQVLTQVIGLMKDLGGRMDAVPPRLDGLLAIRGVLDLVDAPVTDAVRDERRAMIEAGFIAVLDGLIQARAGEGLRLEAILGERLTEIAGLVATAGHLAATQPDAIATRFKQQIAAILTTVPTLPEERLAQELAVLIAKADVREELDRLGAHLSAATDLMAEGATIGRRFDFLCQEFNREANTLCAKSADLGLTKIGIALKAAIEQLREQIQNIE